MLGFCMVCYRLQKIRAKRGDFYPLPHKVPPKHAVCSETLVLVDPQEQPGEHETYYCPKCDELSYPEDVDRPKQLCDGAAHAIR